MKCVYCRKEIPNSGEHQTAQFPWHKKCIKDFFGTDILPQLDISQETLKELANRCINQGFTVPGVQKKLSLSLFVDKSTRLTLVDYPSGYILKPQSDDYTALPEAEYLTMQMARFAGIDTVPFAIMSSNGGERYYITKRIDRVRTKDGIQKLAMEDFCQLDCKQTADKYKGSYERCAKIIAQYSENSNADLPEFFLRIIFSFIVGNSDMHLKNFSLIETSPMSGSHRLSKAYDLLPVNIILPTDKDQTALTLNGKNRNLRRSDFLKFAANCDIPEKTAQKIIALLVGKQSALLEMCRSPLLPESYQDLWYKLISSRICVLTN